MIPEIVVLLPFFYCSKGERRLISQALTALLRDLDDLKNPAVLYEDSHVYGTGLNVMDLVKKKNKDVSEEEES